MKALKIISILAAASMLTVLSACGSSDNSAEESISSTESSENTAESSQTEDNETSENSDAETQEPQKSEDNYGEISKELMTALNDIDNLGGGNFSYDPSDSFKSEDGQTEYALVTDERFSVKEDIEKYMENNLTAGLIAERYSGLLDRYAEKDNKLYGDTAAKGSGFAWTGAEPVISDVTENSFTVDAEYDNYGEVSVMEIKIVSENGTWKIDSFSAQ